MCNTTLAIKVLGMDLKSALCAAFLAVNLASVAVSETVRPVLRSDVRALAQEAAVAALGEHRPAFRPDYMVRYPVQIETSEPEIRPKPRSAFQPEADWDHLSRGPLWTRLVMSAISSHGENLEAAVPRDIDRWCPAYRDNSGEKRRAFWAGMISALAKYESTWRPEAVGGGGLWFGLMQILPGTASHFGCRTTTGEGLKSPAANLSCAVRIMNVTVPRDNAIAVRDGRWRGVAADWGPMTDPNKIAKMAAWTRQQSYCTALDSVRPRPRP